MSENIVIALEIASFIGLVFGYTRKNRKVMLLAALALWFVGSHGLSDAIQGFMDGWQSVANA